MVRFIRPYQPSEFFGSRGLLRCRVSELIVAYKPRLTMYVDNSFVVKHHKQLLSASELEVAGFIFKKEQNISAKRNSSVKAFIKSKQTVNGTRYLVSSIDASPLIIGIIIERLN